MAFRELYPIVIASLLWGHLWTSKRILFYCDNEATVKIIHKGRSKSLCIIKLMRQLTWCSAQFNLCIYSKHLPGKTNRIADALSRFQMAKFRRLAPADLQPTSAFPSHGESSLDTSSRISALMSSSVSSSTQSVYHSGHQTYIKFTQMNNYPLVATENTLMHFATYCLEMPLNLSYQTIKLYLCGIRYHHLLQGIPNPFTLEEKLRNCVVAFFGFPRCAEFTCKSSFDPECNLCFSDLAMHDNHAVLTLKQSKTDPFRKGIDIKLFRTKSTVRPIQQFSAYLPMRNSTFACKPNDPLFIMENGNALTRSRFLEMLKQLLQCAGHTESGITGHSFRTGAATSAAKARIEDHLIKSIGRWSSDSNLRYIRTADSTIQHAQLSMFHSQ